MMVSTVSSLLQPHARFPRARGGPSFSCTVAPSDSASVGFYLALPLRVTRWRTEEFDLDHSAGNSCLGGGNSSKGQRQPALSLAPMPNRFTTVPNGAVPPAGRVLSPVVAVADLFMRLMLSRPDGLSLRTAWVTPGTLVLGGLFTPVAVALAALLLARGGWWIVCAVLLLVAATGSAAVTLVGLAQRRSGG